ncbi:6277_t:CDS:2, partial [Dentiscutata erythropus]
MPKPKRTSKNFDTIESPAKKKATDKESTSDTGHNLISQTQEISIIKEPIKDFLIVVGSYERILYGINGSVAVGSRYLASGSTDEVIKLYDIKKRKELGSLLQHE